MLSDDPQQQEWIDRQRRIVDEGSKAKSFRSSQEWIWFNNTVLKSIEDEAIETLRRATTDIERIKAQQMFLSVDKPRDILEYLIKQGEIAEYQLLSTHQKGG